MIKKIRKYSILIYLSAPVISFAETLGVNEGDSTLKGFIVRIINDYILTSAAALAILFIVIGGIQYITSQGNEEKVSVAKKTLTYAIIGLVIIVFSLAILNYINTKTGEVLTR